MKLGFGFAFSYNEDRQHFSHEQMMEKVPTAEKPKTLIQNVAAHSGELKANIYLNTIGKFTWYDKGKLYVIMII